MSKSTPSAVITKTTTTCAAMIIKGLAGVVRRRRRMPFSLYVAIVMVTGINPTMPMDMPVKAGIKAPIAASVLSVPGTGFAP